MINEAIILAGGLGTRLRSVVADLPKCMAPVNGIPFLHFIVAYLKNEGIKKFNFSLGYKHEMITGYLDENFEDTDKKYIIEIQQLGTGGAINKACKTALSENVVIVNGDTLFTINLNNLIVIHEKNEAGCTLALKEMTGFSRYGSVDLLPDGAIESFHEKKYCEHGYINGGAYVLNVPSFLKEALPEVFSFEKDWLEKNAGTGKIYGGVYQNYFIDIGIPEDYQHFQDDYNSIAAKTKSNENSTKKTPSSFLDNLFKLLD